MIYADNAATTKMSEAAVNAMLNCMENAWGNPSSLYGFGQRAKEILEDGRERIAACIGASPKRSSSPPEEAKRTTKQFVQPRCQARQRGKGTLSPPHLSTTPF